MAQLKILSLNIHGDNHKHEQFAFFAQENPDVICMQEVYAVDVPKFEKLLGMTAVFVELVSINIPNEYNDAPRGPWGIAIFSKFLLKNAQHAFYQMTGPTDSLFPDRGGPDQIARALLWADIKKGGELFTVATTHFTWAPTQEVTPTQQSAFAKLQAILPAIPDLILTGDFNTPRGFPIFDTLAKLYTDNIPKTVTTTISQVLHRVKGLQLVIDVLFTTPTYTVKDVRVVDGVSDHCAVVATIEKV